MDTAKNFVKKMEQILDKCRAEGTFTSKRVLPLNRAFCTVAAEAEAGKRQELFGNGGYRQKTDPVPQRGLGWNWSPSDWLAEQREWLLRECQKSGFGWVYSLGPHHPSALTALAFHCHDGSPKPDFCELGPDFPMILINFTQLNFIHECVPSDMGRQAPFFHAAHGLSRSLYILSALSEEDHHVPHGRYVVPSEALLTDYLQARFDGKVTTKYLKLFMRDGASIDCHGVDQGELIPRIRALFTQPPNTVQFHMGDAATGCGVTINLRNYVITQREVVEQYIPLTLKLTRPQRND